MVQHEAKEPSQQSKSFTQIIPWTGIASLLVMIFCAIAAAIVVGVSQGKYANTWSIQPSVALAIIFAVSNIAFNSAMATGIAVRFWLYASRDAHLSQLHYIWEHGRGFGFLSALRAGSEARTVAVLATIAYITQFASGPLVQRSVAQMVTSSESTQSLYMDVAKRIPDGWFGSMYGDHVIGFLNGIPQQQATERNSSMYTREDPGYVCNGSCHGYVRGAGFTHNCTTSQQYLDMVNTDTNGAVVFATNATRAINSNNQPYLLLTTLYASDVNTSCEATLTITKCIIDAAEVEYPVIVENSTITLRSDELTSMRVVSTYTSDLDLLDQPDGANSGPLGGLAGPIGKSGNPLWTQANKEFSSRMNRTVYDGAMVTLADLFIQVQTPAYAAPDGPMRKCALTWASPTDHILKYMHEFMFRSALRLGMNRTDIIGAKPNGDSEHQQTIIVQRITPESVFIISPSYLGAGIAVMVLAISLIVSLMWGWWHLRRSVTLSPLETVTALADAPELRDIPPGTTLKQILNKVETAAAPGSIGSGEQPRSPPGFRLRKTMTSRLNSSSRRSGTQFHRPGLKKASTFAGTESINIIPSRPCRETQRSSHDIEPVEVAALPSPPDAPAVSLGHPRAMQEA